MPTYEFLCERCKKKFEVNRPMSEYKQKYKCPNCKVDCERVIGNAPGFILKGPGWPGKEIKENNGNKRS